MLINKKTIKKIYVFDNGEEIAFKLVQKKGDWKKKPGWFSKGEKYDETLYSILDADYAWEAFHILYTLEDLKHLYSLLFKDNKLYRKPSLQFYFGNNDYETKYFDSIELRDKFIQDSDLTSFIEI